LGNAKLIANLTCAGLTSRAGAAHYNQDDRDSRSRAVFRFYLRLSGGKTAKRKNRGFWDGVVLMSVRPGDAEQTASAGRRIVQDASEDCVGLTARSANV
jgi:hypothetical protein